MSYKDINKIPSLVKELYAIVYKLEQEYEGRKFTLDGHLVGSIGEVLVSYFYDLELLPSSTEKHDAKAKDGSLVQIKATQGNSVGLRSEPDNLIVIKILKDRSFIEVFNGPGHLAWQNAGNMQKNGQRAISVSKLKKLMNDVANSSRTPKVK